MSAVNQKIEFLKNQTQMVNIGQSSNLTIELDANSSEYYVSCHVRYVNEQNKDESYNAITARAKTLDLALIAYEEKLNNFFYQEKSYRFM